MTTPAATNTTIRVFTRLLDCGQKCARLWHFLRALDQKGSGQVLFSRLWIAQQMGVSVRTVQRWLRQGLVRGWFRRVERLAKGLVAVYLSGIKAVSVGLGVDSLGAISDVSSEHLGRSEAKALCTALEAQHRQRQAYWAAKRAAKGRRKQLVLNPEKMATSETMPGEKSLIRISAPFSVPGCSHAGLAKATNWSQSTIKRRLNNRWRCDLNLDIIEKRRVAAELDDPQLAFELAESGQSFLVTKNALGHGRVIKVSADGLSQLGTNIYHTDYELLSCVGVRRRAGIKKKDAAQKIPA